MKKLFLYYRGFSLIEIVVSVSVIGLMGAVISQIFFTTIRTNTKTERLQEIKQNGNRVISYIERALRNARDAGVAASVDGPFTCDGTSGAVLSITNPDYSKTFIDCATGVTSEPSRLRMQIVPSIAPPGVGPTPTPQGYLTTSDVTVGSAFESDAFGSCVATDIRFTCVVLGDASKSVQVFLMLSQKSAGHDTFEAVPSTTFQTTVSLRNK